MLNLETRIGALPLKNPIMPASGTFSEDLADVIDLGALGAHVTKTITSENQWRKTGNREIFFVMSRGRKTELPLHDLPIAHLAV